MGPNGMQCRKYIDEDFDAIESWAISRGMALERNDLPKLGFIVPNVAVGFMIQTDANCGILEPFIASTHTTAVQRDQALFMVLQSLIDAAKDLGFKRVFGFSHSPTMIARAEKLGMNVVDVNTVVHKEF